VLTNLGRVGMPIIRYRTGDRVRLAGSPSGSGLSFVRLENGVIGRVDDALIIRGVNVFPSAVENLVREFSEIGEFAVDVYRRDSLDDMVLRVEIAEGDAKAVAEGLGKSIRTSLGLRVIVEAVQCGTLPRFDHKARRFSDHRPA
jgi:phenylacetate-CoA ligase